MNAILEELGNPHKDLNIIHVAGSKGKGSTCAIAAYILKEAGYKVGLYTSPHLVDFKERIRILNDGPDGPREFEGMIGEEEVNEILKEIKPVAENFREHRTLGKASFFEILTACAFLYFKKRQVDIAVLEVGLGGRLDATNVAMPLVSGITNISLEHTDKLGNTLAKIAYEKAGIIKEHSLVVSASQETEAMDVIRKVCIKRDAELYEIGKDIKYSILNSGEKGQVFDLKGPEYSYKNLEVSLIGVHQIENASIGIGMLKLMDPDRFNIRENDIREGLKKVSWSGRLQVIQRSPYIVLDGAHNLVSATALADSIKKLFSYRKLICVFGISSDKDIKGVSSVLDIISDIIILTQAKNNPRAEDVSRLKQNFRNSRPGLEESSNIEEAMQKALRLADKDDLILVTGSLFIVGEAMARLKM
ncbi:MAG: bifunctional folylpolyglutamate synthase/dihydrofolate synthase [Candidatus Omnitrophica bacterium]|nr:bifunctional folylpolyglutamate synthase/dihydrofolate synthase [Candidatus Omnitrophota bacterium]